MDAALGERVVAHLSALLRIDTTNPPGRETPAAEYLAQVLYQDGLEPKLLGRAPERQNVIARLRGDGSLPPLLLNAHLDVVPAEAGAWRHPPFAGEIRDGYLWGRGAIDMKHMAVMSALVLGRLKAEGVKLRRDVIFAGVADEEAGCDHGSAWLVEHHPDLVRAELALGEVGGFTVYLGGRALYPVQVAEKGLVWMKLRARGKPGHGSLPREDNSVVKLARAIARLGRTRLPIHRTRVVEQYLAAIAATQKKPLGLAIRGLFNRRIADLLLSRLPDRGTAAALSAALSNTAVPTVLAAGQKTNVVPGVAEAEVDGRSLPGQSTADLVAEVRRVVGADIEIEVLKEAPPVEHAPHPGLWSVLKESIERHHPGAQVIPYLTPGFTDAKSWARLGCRHFGFTPLRFPDDGTKFGDLYHGHDERVPVEGLKWGVQVLYDVVRRFCGVQ